MRIIFLISLLVSVNAIAQDALIIKYGNQLNLAMSEQAKANPQIRAHHLKMSSEIIDYELVLLNNEAQYTLLEKIGNEQSEGKSFSTSISVGGGASNKRYTNYNTGIHYRETEVNGKNTYIKSDLKTFDWEISRETKEILGVEVRKAIYTDGDTKGIAWYAPKIGYKAGPLDIAGLPGLILEYERLWTNNNGLNSERIFAQEISFVDPSLVKITQPDDKKSISQEEYNIIFDKQRKKFREMYSQGVETSD